MCTLALDVTFVSMCNLNYDDMIQQLINRAVHCRESGLELLSSHHISDCTCTDTYVKSSVSFHTMYT